MGGGGRTTKGKDLLSWVKIPEPKKRGMGKLCKGKVSKLGLEGKSKENLISLMGYERGKKGSAWEMTITSKSTSAEKTIGKGYDKRKKEIKGFCCPRRNAE